MRITFDPATNEKNIAQRGLSFELAAELEWNTALMREDVSDYGETRLRALALLQGRLHAVVVTPRQEELRVISFRKANRKEERLYEKEKPRPRTP